MKYGEFGATPFTSLRKTPFHLSVERLINVNDTGLKAAKKDDFVFRKEKTGIDREYCPFLPIPAASSKNVIGDVKQRLAQLTES